MSDVNINLNEVSYKAFLNSFQIYSSKKEAKAKNYEAHHIIPISIQLKEYNIKNNSKLSREEFTSLKIHDDRCIRCTPLEHLIIHFLAARDLGESYIELFYQMQNRNFKKISIEDKNVLASLKEWALFIQRGKESMKKSKKDYYANMGPEKKKELQKLYKEVCNTPSHKQKCAESHIKFWYNQSDDQFKAFCKSQLKARSTSEVKEHLSQGQKKNYHKNMSLEEKQSFKNRCIKVGKEIIAPRMANRRILYKEKLKNGSFKGSWNEFQIWCKDQNEVKFQKDFEEASRNQKYLSATSYRRFWTKNKLYLY